MAAVIPIHFAGGLLEGNIGDTSFSYRLGVGNGRSEDDIHDTPDLNDTFDDMAFLAGGSYRSKGRTRFEAGVTAFVDESISHDGISVDERIYSAYFALLSETPELIVEYTYAEHDARQSKGNVNSVYAQLAYRLQDGASSLKPYVRIEDLDVDDSDPLLGMHDQNYSGITAGVRWDYSDFGALKTEFRNEKFGRADRANGFWLQLTFVHSMARRF